MVRAAEKKRIPLILQVFPWAISFGDGLLLRAAADAAKRATVPVAVLLDHAQDVDLFRGAADALPFDSFMIAMSLYDKAENLSRTAELVRFCHVRGIAVKVEPGRIEGGEEVVADTAELTAMLTTDQEVIEFVNTGVDFLAPAFRNVHGQYGPGGPQLDFSRLLISLV